MTLRAGALFLERRLYFRLRARADRLAVERPTLEEGSPKPAHLFTGERGEDLAYFYLRGLGYSVVARRWHSSYLKGDLDLVAWDGDTLVIFEIKTRTAHDFAPAESAVDEKKQNMLCRMAAAYRGRLPQPWRDHVPLRFDIVSVYDLPAGPEFLHLRSAFPFSA